MAEERANEVSPREKSDGENKLESESLVIPGVDVVMEAGRLLSDLPALWRHAGLEERRETPAGDAGRRLRGH